MDLTVLYSTGCPQCNVLKEKLKAANIDYIEVTDKDTIIAKGITKVPVLEVDGIQMALSAANEWIKSRSN
ncbi:MAG: glutaredoxin [Alistipes sp.]|nr:glutaredoxin [Clostridia bacterium]MBR2031204.1 glutaredoxin [Alistipes sp.]MBR2859513.1 glutaredoxin [Alistipes sp.]